MIQRPSHLSMNGMYMSVMFKLLSKKKPKVADDAALTRDAQFATGSRRPRQDPTIVIQSVKDVDNITDATKPLPSSKKELTKVF